MKKLTLLALLLTANLITLGCSNDNAGTGTSGTGTTTTPASHDTTTPPAGGTAGETK